MTASVCNWISMTASPHEIRQFQIPGLHISGIFVHKNHSENAGLEKFWNVTKSGMPGNQYQYQYHSVQNVQCSLNTSPKSMWLKPLSFVSLLCGIDGDCAPTSWYAGRPPLPLAGGPGPTAFALGVPWNWNALGCPVSTSRGVPSSRCDCSLHSGLFTCYEVANFTWDSHAVHFDGMECDAGCMGVRYL